MKLYHFLLIFSFYGLANPDCYMSVDELIQLGTDTLKSLKDDRQLALENNDCIRTEMTPEKRLNCGKVENGFDTQIAEKNLSFANRIKNHRKDCQNLKKMIEAEQKKEKEELTKCEKYSNLFAEVNNDLCALTKEQLQEYMECIPTKLLNFRSSHCNVSCADKPKSSICNWSAQQVNRFNRCLNKAERQTLKSCSR